MSIPVMLGAACSASMILIRDKELVAPEGPGLALAFVVAALVGFVCIKWFLAFVEKHSLIGFGVYCCAVSVLGLLAQAVGAG